MSSEKAVLRAFLLAGQKGDLATILSILKKSPSIINAQHDDVLRGTTALIGSACSGSIVAIRMLLRYGAEIDVKNKDGHTALHMACWNGHDSCIEALIQEGADIEALSINKATPLRMAVHNGHISSVCVLLQNGANPNARTGNKNTILHSAARQGHMQIVEILLNANCDVSAVNAGNSSPLNVARDLPTRMALLGCPPLPCPAEKFTVNPFRYLRDPQRRSFLDGASFLYRAIRKTPFTLPLAVYPFVRLTQREKIVLLARVVAEVFTGSKTLPSNILTDSCLFAVFDTLAMLIQQPTVSEEVKRSILDCYEIGFGSPPKGFDVDSPAGPIWQALVHCIAAQFFGRPYTQKREIFLSPNPLVDGGRLKSAAYFLSAPPAATDQLCAVADRLMAEVCRHRSWSCFCRVLQSVDDSSALQTVDRGLYPSKLYASITVPSEDEWANLRGWFLGLEASERSALAVIRLKDFRALLNRTPLWHTFRPFLTPPQAGATFGYRRTMWGRTSKSIGPCDVCGKPLPHGLDADGGECVCLPVSPAFVDLKKEIVGLNVKSLSPKPLFAMLKLSLERPTLMMIDNVGKLFLQYVKLLVCQRVIECGNRAVQEKEADRAAIELLEAESIETERAKKKKKARARKRKARRKRMKSSETSSQTDDLTERTSSEVLEQLERHTAEGSMEDVDVHTGSKCATCMAISATVSTPSSTTTTTILEGVEEEESAPLSKSARRRQRQRRRKRQIAGEEEEEEEEERPVAQPKQAVVEETAAPTPESTDDEDSLIHSAFGRMAIGSTGGSLPAPKSRANSKEAPKFPPLPKEKVPVKTAPSPVVAVSPEVIPPSVPKRNRSRSGSQSSSLTAETALEWVKSVLIGEKGRCSLSVLGNTLCQTNSARYSQLKETFGGLKPFVLKHTDIFAVQFDSAPFMISMRQPASSSPLPPDSGEQQTPSGAPGQASQKVVVKTINAPGLELNRVPTNVTRAQLSRTFKQFGDIRVLRFSQPRQGVGTALRTVVVGFSTETEARRGLDTLGNSPLQWHRHIRMVKVPITTRVSDPPALPLPKPLPVRRAVSTPQQSTPSAPGATKAKQLPAHDWVRPLSDPTPSPAWPGLKRAGAKTAEKVVDPAPKASSGWGSDVDRPVSTGWGSKVEKSTGWGVPSEPAKTTATGGWGVEPEEHTPWGTAPSEPTTATAPVDAPSSGSWTRTTYPGSAPVSGGSSWGHSSMEPSSWTQPSGFGNASFLVSQEPAPLRHSSFSSVSASDTWTSGSSAWETATSPGSSTATGSSFPAFSHPDKAVSPLTDSGDGKPPTSPSRLIGPLLRVLEGAEPSPPADAESAPVNNILHMLDKVAVPSLPSLTVQQTAPPPGSGHQQFSPVGLGRAVSDGGSREESSSFSRFFLPSDPVDRSYSDQGATRPFDPPSALGGFGSAAPPGFVAQQPRGWSNFQQQPATTSASSLPFEAPSLSALSATAKPWSGPTSAEKPSTATGSEPFRMGAPTFAPPGQQEFVPGQQHFW